MKKKGFTLIELLVVIAIIAILAGIVIIAVNPARQVAQARNAQRRADVLTTLNAVYQFYLDNGNFPVGIGESYQQLGTDKSACNVDCGGWTLGTSCLDIGSAIEPVLVPTYITAIPQDPQGSENQTGYAVSQDGDGRITIRSCNSFLETELSANIEVTR